MKNKIDKDNDRINKYLSLVNILFLSLDKKGDIEFINEKGCQILGLNVKDIIGKNWFDNFLPKETLLTAKSAFDNIIERKIEDTSSYQIPIINSDGNEIMFSWKNTILKDDSGIVTEVFCSGIDISEKIETEKQLEKTRMETKSLFDNAGLGIGYYTPDGKVIWFNKVAAEYWGKKPEDFTGKPIYELLPNKNGDRLIKRIGEVVKANKPLEFSDEYEYANGKEYFLNTYNVIKSDDDQLLGVEVISQDVTDLRKAEISLKESEKRYRDIFDQANIGMCNLSVPGEYLNANKKYCEILGYSFEELTKLTVFDVTYTEDLEKTKASFDNLTTGKTESNSYEKRYVRKDGKIISAIITSRLIKDSKNKPLYSVSTIQDITERRESEKRISHLASFPKFNTDPIIELSQDGRLSYSNPSAKNLFPDLKSLGICHPFLANWQINLPQILAQGATPLTQEIMVGDCFYSQTFQHIKSSDTIRIYARNITERKKLEEEKILMAAQISQQQRLEAIDTLASGVAHEINNPLNGIMNYGQLILDSSNADSEHAEFSAEIIHESNRVSVIVKNLLQFSRDEKQEHSFASIGDIINNTMSLINTVIKQDQIDLQIDIPEDLPKLKCRSQQIQQIIMNLMTNARDALNEKYEGYHKNKKIILTCEKTEKNGRAGIRVIIEDHGNGIPIAIRETIFEPFFTSKGRNKGTGLGLSISHGIVKEHHGNLSFETEEGKYTKFFLDLPVDNGWELE